MGLHLGIFYCFIFGSLLLFQQRYCYELLSSHEKANLEETTESLVTTRSSTSFSHQNASGTKYSVTSTTTIHTTRLHQVTEPQNDTLFDNLCITKDNNVDNNANQNYKIYSMSGDIIVTFILNQSDNETEIIRAIVDHINGIDLLVHNVSIGVRIVKILKQQSPKSLLDLLEVEIDFLEHCVENPFGIFLSNDLWHYELLKGKKFEFKIWQMSAIEDIKLKRVAHVLKELALPTSLQNASVEIRSDSLLRTGILENALKMENLCLNAGLNHSDSLDNEVYIYVGYADFLNEANFKHSTSPIIIPLSMKNFILTNIPYQSFIAIEREIIFNEVTSSSSEFTAVAATFLTICKSINEAIMKKCENSLQENKFQLKNCEIFNDYHISEEASSADLQQVLQSLKLQSLENKMTYELFEKLSSPNSSYSVELKKISTTNFVTNVTTVYKQDQQERISFESIMRCEESTNHSSQNETSLKKHVNSFEIDGKYPIEVNKNEFDMNDYASEVYEWRIRTELWVAVGLTVSTLGILLSIAIVTFIIVRVCLEDVLEGNPIGSITILLALIAQFASFFPFTIEPIDNSKSFELSNSMCIIRIYVVSVAYCLTFSLILSRAVMLASIGSEGGFLSHVNGYIQSIICVFSFLVQLGLSTQLLIIFHAHQRHKLTCNDVFYGNWLWGTLGYDAFLLILLVLLTPLIFRSQRNYREGILITITSILCAICWVCWIPLAMINSNIREMIVPLACQTTGWIILSSLMVPRCFLIVKSIARSDFTQALPSLTSLAFAQANHFISEPSIYECVNPNMQTISNGISETNTEDYLSPSEVPTLPLRGGRLNLNSNFNELITPNKITRF